MSMKKEKFFGIFCLLMVAVIFGFAFSFQSIAAAHMTPFLLNGVRFLLSSLVLSPVLFRKKLNKTLLLAGFLDGLFLFLATGLQQTAIQDTSAGKTGFLTALYIVFVPLVSFLFFRKRFGRNVVFSIFLALAGLYLLCGLSMEDPTLRPHDFYLILTAFFFAMQILVIERYVTVVDPFPMSTIAFFTCGILSLLCGFFLEPLDFSGITPALGAILYLSLGSTCLGYGFQAVGQQLVESTAASLLMSLESIFSLIGGYLLLHQTLTEKELLGALLLFIAVILCQIPDRRRG